MNWLYDNLKGELPLPEWAIKKNIKNCFFYSGKSMCPTFKDGYLIYTLSKEKIDASDVIVYKEKDQPNITVHRVIMSSEAGLVTRGDNNATNDPLPIAPEQILGVVEYFEKRGQIRPVPKGKIYLTKLKLKWNIRRVLKNIKQPLGFIYRSIKKSGIFRIAFGKLFDGQTKNILLKTSLGPLRKTILFGKTIVIEWPARHMYSCKKPFDLFVSEEGNRHLVDKR